MSTSNIGIGFSIKKFPLNLNFDTRINCREEFAFLRYSSKFSGSSAGVSFLNSDPINVADNIITQDLTESIPENSPRKFFERIENSQQFLIETGEFLITDVFKTTSTGELVPLYLRHSLNEFANIADVEILDVSFNPVNPDLYVYYDETATLGSASKFIYTNLENSYDRVQNEYVLYYYRFRDTSTGRLILGLLDTKSFYKTSDFSTSQNNRAYRVDAGNTESTVQVWFNSLAYSPTPVPLVQRYSIKSAGSDRIAVLPPIDLPANQRWYPRISLSQFYRNSGVGGDRLFYHVPEYFNQFFSPVPPYKTLIEKEATVINERLLYVAPSPIASLGVTGFYISIVLKDEMGRAVRAFTTDPTGSLYINKDKVITDVFYEKDMIQSIDSAHGFIRLNNAIDTSLTPYVTYRYEEDYLTYRGINVNSTTNPNVLNTKILFYVIPEGDTPNVQSVFHIQIDDSDNILDAAQSESMQTYNGVNSAISLNQITDAELGVTDAYTGFEVEILSGQNAGRRIAVQSYSPTTKVLTLAVAMTDALEVGIQYRVNKKSESYTYTDIESSTTFSYTGWLDQYVSAPFYYVLLGNMFVIQTLAPRDINGVDIRIRGGGVKQKRLEEALGLQDEVQWYWDTGYWDGQPFPGMAAIIVEIPRKVLVEVGGSFTRAQINDVVSKHMAEGTYPIIKFYDRSTNITRVEPGNNQALVRWQDVEAGFYNIYYGTNPDSLVLFRSVSGAIHEIVVDGLENDRMYYFRVDSVVGGYPQLPSRIMMAVPFNASTVMPGAVYGQTIYGEGTYQNG